MGRRLAKNLNLKQLKLATDSSITILNSYSMMNWVDTPPPTTMNPDTVQIPPSSPSSSSSSSSIHANLKILHLTDLLEETPIDILESIGTQLTCLRLSFILDHLFSPAIGPLIASLRHFTPNLEELELQCASAASDEDDILGGGGGGGGGGGSYSGGNSNFVFRSGFGAVSLHMSIDERVLEDFLKSCKLKWVGISRKFLRGGTIFPRLVMKYKYLHFSV